MFCKTKGEMILEISGRVKKNSGRRHGEGNTSTCMLSRTSASIWIYLGSRVFFLFHTRSASKLHLRYYQATYNHQRNIMSDAAAAPAPAKATPKKPKTTKPKVPAAHPTYKVMVAAAITALKERGGSSRQAILKYIIANYKVGSNTTLINAHLKTALKSGVKSETLKQSKGTGAAGSFRLGEKKAEKKPKAKKSPKKAVKPKKPAAAKKAKSPKKETKAKKPAAKKAAKPKKVTKSPAKKAAKSPAKKAAKPKVAKKPAAKKTPAKKVAKPKVAKK